MLVTTIGARRPADGVWLPAILPEELKAGVHDNVRSLGLDALVIVNYRSMRSSHGLEEGSMAEQIEALAFLNSSERILERWI